MDKASSLPDPSYLLVAAIILGVFVLIGIGIILRFGQGLRKGLAAELKRELSTSSEPSPVAVQQPLLVSPHREPATVEFVETVKTEVHGRIKRERAEIDAQIRRVEDLADKRADKLEGKIDENTKLTSAMSGEVKQINQTVSQLSTSLTSFLANK